MSVHTKACQAMISSAMNVEIATKYKYSKVHCICSMIEVAS